MAITAGLLAYGTLALPWPVRLLLGAFGVVVLALSFPAAWRWVLDGGDEDT
jgi:hypothetical protein